MHRRNPRAKRRPHYPTRCKLALVIVLVFLTALVTLFQAASRFQGNSNHVENKSERTRVTLSRKVEVKDASDDRKQEQVTAHPLVELSCSPLVNDIVKDVKQQWQRQDSNHEEHQIIAAVLVMAYNRPQYLSRTLDTIGKRLSARSIANKFPVFVSQDGSIEEVARVIKSYSFIKGHFIHESRDDLETLESLVNVEMHMRGYYHICEHYKWAFTQLFDCLSQSLPPEWHGMPQFDKVLVIEDDMEISIDFFSYFEATSVLLDMDPTVYTISSWNDLGFTNLVGNPREIYRTDFFPGLGWMLNRRLWDELKPKWPKAFWDDFMRQDEQRKGRQSIIPEISRNHNFGSNDDAGGTSLGQYGDDISRVKSNDVYVNFVEENVVNLLMKETFDERFHLRVNNSVLIQDIAQLQQQLVGRKGLTRDSRIEYATLDDLKTIQGVLGLHTEVGSRGSYENILHVRINKHMLYICPTTRIHYNNQDDDEDDNDDDEEEEDHSTVVE